MAGYWSGMIRSFSWFFLDGYTPVQTIFLSFFAGGIYKEGSDGDSIWLVAGAG